MAEREPKAVAIPKEFENLEMGRYGTIWPSTPACYGFTLIANVKPGKAEAIREYGVKLSKAPRPGTPFAPGEDLLFCLLYCDR